MTNRKLLGIGISGTVIAAICCFTPVLVILVGFAGLSAVVGWLDYGLFPILFAFMALVAYALYLRFGRVGRSPVLVIAAAVVMLSAVLFWLEFKYALGVFIATGVGIALYALYLSVRARRGNRRVPETRETFS